MIGVMKRSLLDSVNSAARRVPTWVVYTLGLLPVPFLLYLAQTGGLGREPIRALEHELGEIALQLLIAVLCISPLRRYVGLNLLKFRRAVGLLSFIYVALHLLVWLVLDVGIISQIWTDILKRPYITIGMVSFVLMLPLALTSNNASVRAMGPNWFKLHRLTYVAAILGGAHFIMLAKTWAIEPLAYMTAVLVLLALRFPKALRKRAA
ncbi:MAG: protein-methionine-sulfoxide reductase heme-binding subunit MsrQ [Roseobacter sp.]